MLVLLGCGDDDGGGESGSGRQGGSITITQTTQPDYLDPALGYQSGSFEPMWLVYTPLLTYNARRARRERG